MFHYVLLDPGTIDDAVAAGQMGLGRLVDLLVDFRRDILLVETDAWRVDAELGERVKAIPNEFQNERRQIKELLTWIRRHGPMVILDQDDESKSLVEFAESVAELTKLDLILAPGPPKQICENGFRTNLASCHNSDLFTRRSRLAGGSSFVSGETNFMGLASTCFGKLVLHANTIRVFDYALGEYYNNDQPVNLKRLVRFLRDHAPNLKRLELHTMEDARVSLGRDVRDLQNEVDFEIQVDYRPKRELPHPRYLGADKRYLDIDRGIDLCDAHDRCRNTVIKYASSPE